MLLWLLPLLLPTRDQLWNQVLVALQLLRQEGEEVQPELLLKGHSHRLLSQLVKELMSQSLSRIQSMLGGVNHDLSQEVMKQRV